MLPLLPDQAGSALHLVRHGQSTWNVQQLVQGQSDQSELTDLGCAQARQVAQLLVGTNAVRLLASDLRRARQTADIIGDVLALQTISVGLLREQSFGALEGLPTERAVQEWERVASRAVDEYGDPLPMVDVRLAGGESMRDVLARVQAFLALPWITEASGDVVIVTHGDTIRVMLAHLLGDDFDDLTWREIGNGEVHSVYRTSAGKVAHLRTGPGSVSVDD